jgi:hypothetical protein
MGGSWERKSESYISLERHRPIKQDIDPYDKEMRHGDMYWSHLSEVSN